MTTKLALETNGVECLMSRNFPSFIDEFIRYATSSGSPEKYAKWCAISAISAALERKCWIWLGDKPIFPNQYILLVGGSGTRKSATADLITDIIYELDDIAFMPSQMTAAALILSITDAGDEKKFNYNGVDYKHSGLFAYASEAATMLKDNEQLQEILTDFYGCGTPTFWSNKHGWIKRTVGNGKSVVFNPCLNFLGCSTAEWLNDIIGEKSIKGGFIPRFLLVQHKEQAKASGWKTQDIKSQQRSTKPKLIQDLNKIHKISGEFIPDHTFKEVFDAFEKSVVEKINREDDKQPFYNRKIVHCLKVAMAICADQSESMTITGNHLAKAIEYVTSIEEDMYDCFYGKGPNKTLGSLIDCWEIIRKKQVWKKSEILNATIRKCSPAELDSHLRTLFEMKKIKADMSEGLIKYVVTDNSPVAI